MIFAVEARITKKGPGFGNWGPLCSQQVYSAGTVSRGLETVGRDECLLALR